MHSILVFVTFISLIYCAKGKNDCDASDSCSLTSRCLFKMRLARQCSGFLYPAVYRNSATDKFQITVANHSRHKYVKPENFKMAIARVSGKNYTLVKDCCNLKEGETCKLPPLTQTNVKYTVFATMQTRYVRQQRHRYCRSDIAVRNGKYPQWCSEDREPPCLFFNDGILGVNDSHTTIATIGWPSRYFTEYCTFYIPKHHVKYANIEYGSAPPLIALNTSIAVIRGEKVTGKDFDTECKVIEGGTDFNIYDYMVPRDDKNEMAICALYRIAKYSDKWDSTPVCVNTPEVQVNFAIEGQKKGVSYLMIITVTCLPLVILIAAVIGIFLICRKFERKNAALLRHISTLNQVLPADRYNDFSKKTWGKSADRKKRSSNSSGRLLIHQNSNESSYTSTLEEDVFPVIPYGPFIESEKKENFVEDCNSLRSQESDSNEKMADSDISDVASQTEDQSSSGESQKIEETTTAYLKGHKQDYCELSWQNDESADYIRKAEPNELYTGKAYNSSFFHPTINALGEITA